MTSRPRRSRPSSFDARYGPHWPQTSKQAREIVKGRCILNPLHRATEVHHLRYRDIFGAIANRERPGWDVVPLCRKCHGRVHRKESWHSARRSPELKNCNRWPMLWSLRLRFYWWAFFLNGGWIFLAIPLALLAWAWAWQ